MIWITVIFVVPYIDDDLMTSFNMMAL